MDESAVVYRIAKFLGMTPEEVWKTPRAKVASYIKMARAGSSGESGFMREAARFSKKMRIMDLIDFILNEQ